MVKVKVAKINFAKACHKGNLPYPQTALGNSEAWKNHDDVNKALIALNKDLAKLNKGLADRKVVHDNYKNEKVIMDSRISAFKGELEELRSGIKESQAAKERQEVQFFVVLAKVVGGLNDVMDNISSREEEWKEGLTNLSARVHANAAIGAANPAQGTEHAALVALLQ